MALLAALGMAVGLGGAGWVVGLVCGVVTNAAVARGLARGGGDALGPADLVTLTRATLACGVAALTADALLGQPVLTTMVPLAVAALALDAVDGWVARRTRTASAFGARFDGEVDAFLILVLSVYGPARSASGCSRSARPAMRSPWPAGGCTGCADERRRATGARWWPRRGESS